MYNYPYLKVHKDTFFTSSTSVKRTFLVFIPLICFEYTVGVISQRYSKDTVTRLW
jgi:hypothetical protein